LADGAIGIQQALAELVQSGAAPEDQIVAVLDFRKEQAMLAAGLLAFFLGEERRERGEPFRISPKAKVGIGALDHNDAAATSFW